LEGAIVENMLLAGLPYALLAVLLVLVSESGVKGGAVRPPYVVLNPNFTVNISTLPTCPFSRWLGEPRRCFECLWCPFRSSSCCETEDEVDVLKSVQVSGTDAWDCFITIVYFQQCGRCSPSARSYLQRVDQEKRFLEYVWDARNLSIRPCRLACENIYSRCKGALMLDGRPVIPDTVSSEEYCAEYPVVSTPALPCYNAAGGLASAFSSLVLFVALLMTVLELM
jgi:hypothetical protein